MYALSCIILAKEKIKVNFIKWRFLIMANNVILSGVITTKPEHKIAYGEISTRFSMSIVGATGLIEVKIACYGDVSRKVLDSLRKNSSVVVIGKLGNIVSLDNAVRQNEGIGVIADEIYPAEFPPILTDEDKKRAERKKHIEEELAKLNDDDVPF